MVLVCIIEYIEEFLSFCSLKLRYLGWDFSVPPSSFTAISWSATWDFPPYIYRKLYQLFCRLEPADSPWDVVGASRPTHQTHKHTAVSPGELWLAYPLNYWCMVGIFGAVPRLRTLRRQPRNLDLILGIGFQWSDKDSSLCWLSYLKKSLMSASGRAFRVNDILVMSTAFTLADCSFLAAMFRPMGDLLLNVCQPTLGMTTAMGLKPFFICIKQILWIQFGQ